ncbi:hypothetical protein D0Z07_1395 [Hyphodiscus hymeniophilus]|uniref:DUF567-domain-containing protein n=1 Tax=Hyphodiscus hymeniophilus TaxID=353542 RepID=A0A9P6VQM5_9HELO|nr:hypothetical protein D0Z07_1395 [Hyphodiscus hymeniophilus]
MATINLPPVQPILGVNPSYCVPHQTTLVMREKVWSLSGDTFHIVDQNNHEVLQCRGQALSLSDRKEFADSSGRPLFSLRTRHFTIHKTFYGQAGDGRELFEVKGKFSLGGSKMLATFTNTASSNAAVELLIKGDWFDRSAEIKMGNVVVAQIARKMLNMREIFGGQQTYFVTVAPGVDLSLIAAVCVCLDEKENETK